MQPDTRTRIAHQLIYGVLLGMLLSAWTTLRAESRVLVLSNNKEAPYNTDARDGYVDLIAFEAFRRAGVELKVIALPSERGLRNANAGLHDGELTRIAGLDKQYTNLVRVPEKIMDWEFAAFSKTPEKIVDIATIRAHPVGLIKGWKIYEQLTAGAAAVTTANDAEQLFRLLDLRRIDTALYERWLGLALLRRLGMDDVAPQNRLVEKREMFIYLHQRHADLVPRLAAALREMKAEGFYERAYRAALAPYLDRKKQ